jgi:hypothetical protein
MAAAASWKTIKVTRRTEWDEGSYARCNAPIAARGVRTLRCAQAATRCRESPKRQPCKNALGRSPFAQEGGSRSACSDAPPNLVDLISGVFINWVGHIHGTPQDPGHGSA